MTEHELLKNLNNLKSVNPEAAWLKSNREILLAQISNSGAENLSVWKEFSINLNSLVRTVSRPAFALGSFFVILFTAALFGHQALNQIKPNDSLYIARVISERARLNTVFNEVDRDQLAMQFATERAKDITTILSDPNFNNEAHQSEVAKLNQNFNQEITTVKNAISRSKPSQTTQSVPATDDTVISAESAKDNQGVQVYESKPGEIIKVSETIKNNNLVKATSTATTTATSTATTTTSVKVEAPDKNTMIDEAQKMFDNKEYNNALNKLNEVDELIKK